MGKASRNRQRRAGAAHRRAADRARRTALTAILLDPDTPPGTVAKALIDGRAADVLEYPIEEIWHNTSPAHARAVAEAALALAPDAYDALMFAEGIFGLCRDESRSEELLRRAMAARPDEPIPRYVLAGVLTDAGRPDEAVTLMDPLCIADPDDLSAHAERATALREIARRIVETPQGAPCDCGSGAPYEGCHFDDDDAHLAAMRDGATHARLHDAALEHWHLPKFSDMRERVMERIYGDPRAGERLPEDLPLAIEVAMFVVPLDETDDDTFTMLSHMVIDPATPPEIKAGAMSWYMHKRWGLWQVTSPLDRPMVWLRDVISGYPVVVANDLWVPEAARRWGALLGSVAPDGAVWRFGHTIALAPWETEALAATVADLFDSVMDVGPVIGHDPRQPAIAEPLFTYEGAESARLISGMVAGAMPQLLAAVREMKEHLPDMPALLAVGAEGLLAQLEAWADEPSEMLDGATPRDAVREPKLAARVEARLRTLEYLDDRPDAHRDYGDLRRRLGIGHV